VYLKNIRHIKFNNYCILGVSINDKLIQKKALHLFEISSAAHARSLEKSFFSDAGTLWLVHRLEAV